MSEPVRYPDPAVRILDPRFERYRLSNAAVERIAGGCRWAEGPVWFGDLRCLIWSDIPNDRMLRWDELTGTVGVFRHPSNNANGNTRDRRGRLVTCEHRTRRVTRTEYDGSLSVLADHFGGTRLNAPNDVVARSDGSLWFTDPGYGIMTDYEGRRATAELPTAVYRLDPGNGALTVVTTELERPNGLCFSPDETLLYVVDSGSAAPAIHSFETTSTGTAHHRGVLVHTRPAVADGVRCDEDGNLWAAMSGGEGIDGLHVFTSAGTETGRVLLPEPCANLCFGGATGNRLLMTASQSVYSLFVNTRGA